MAQFRTDIKKYATSHDVTRHEVFMLNDRLTPSGTLTDAFGRLRISPPLTLFDSSHRYQDNGLWATSNTATANATFIPNQSTITMNVDNTDGAEVVRETKRVFVYQPGKSLLIMNTFVMQTPTANLRQRVGYFNSQNGIYLENNGTTNYLVLRTFTSSAVDETRVAQANWNIDKFDGTGYSAQGTQPEHSTGLDVSKSNIFWIDVEWLGVGDIRAGFVIDGRFCTAHIFHNDNRNTLPYMTTATLPLRYEIKNTGVVSGSSTLKQICSTVISEGGYQLFGTQRAVGVPITSAKDLPTAGTTYPVISIQLKSNRLDAAVIITALSILGKSNNPTTIRWSVHSGVTLTNPNWVSAGDDSSVEYDLSATAMSGGKQAATGYLSVTNQASTSIDILKEALFRFQLERNGLTSTPIIFTLAATPASNGDDVLGSIDWEEITS
jgi:hypothetical protein